MSELRIEGGVLRSEDLSRSEHMTAEKVIIRCGQALETVQVCGMPNAWLLVLELDRPGDLVVRNMPALRRILLSGVKSVDAELGQPLDYLEMRHVKKSSWHQNQTMPTTADFGIQDGKVPFVSFRKPSEVKRVGLHSIHDHVRLDTWMTSLRNLEALSVHNCKSICIDGIEHFAGLRSLSLVDVGNVPSIDFLEHLGNIESLNLGGSTTVVSGDLSPILSLKRLDWVLFANRRHYNLRLKKYDGRMQNLVHRAHSYSPSHAPGGDTRCSE